MDINTRYLQLQSIPLSNMSIIERDELQDVLGILINDNNTSEHDLHTYYLPRYNAYDAEIKYIKKFTAEQIAQQEAVILIAQEKIARLRRKLEE